MRALVALVRDFFFFCSISLLAKTANRYDYFTGLGETLPTGYPCGLTIERISDAMNSKRFLEQRTEIPNIISEVLIFSFSMSNFIFHV